MAKKGFGFFGFLCECSCAWLAVGNGNWDIVGGAFATSAEENVEGWWPWSCSPGQSWFGLIKLDGKAWLYQKPWWLNLLLIISEGTIPQTTSKCSPVLAGSEKKRKWERKNQTCFDVLFLFPLSSLFQYLLLNFIFYPHHLLVILIKWFHLKQLLEINWDGDVCLMFVFWSAKADTFNGFNIGDSVLDEISVSRKGIVMAFEPCPSPVLLLIDEHPLQVDKKENKEISPPAFNWIYWEEPRLRTWHFNHYQPRQKQMKADGDWRENKPELMWGRQAQLSPAVFINYY